jgi:hypothetical protein
VNPAMALCLFMSVNTQVVVMRKEDTARQSSSFGRRKEYQLANRVEQRQTGRVFIKCSTNPASRPFLDVICEREKLAAERFRGHAEVVSGSKVGDSLVYSFLDKLTLEQEIGRIMSTGDTDFALSAVRQYRKFLDALPRVRCLPSGFYDFLGVGQIPGEKPVDCLDFGPYDCIPRNLIRDSTGWKVLDSEWTFPFPLPVDFLFWRGIHSLVYGLQKLIQSMVNAGSPVILYQGYGQTRVYMPLAWYKEFELGAMDLSRFETFEGCFQQKILDPEAVRRGRLRMINRLRVYASLPKAKSLLICCEEWIKHAARFVQANFPRASLTSRNVVALREASRNT